MFILIMRLKTFELKTFDVHVSVDITPKRYPALRSYGLNQLRWSVHVVVNYVL